MDRHLTPPTTALLQDSGSLRYLSSSIDKNGPPEQSVSAYKSHARRPILSILLWRNNSAGTLTFTLPHQPASRTETILPLQNGEPAVGFIAELNNATGPFVATCNEANLAYVYSNSEPDKAERAGDYLTPFTSKEGRQEGIVYKLDPYWERYEGTDHNLDGSKTIHTSEQTKTYRIDARFASHWAQFDSDLNKAVLDQGVFQGFGLVLGLRGEMENFLKNHECESAAVKQVTGNFIRAANGQQSAQHTIT